jgi:hypothetical protein
LRPHIRPHKRAASSVISPAPPVWRPAICPTGCGAATPRPKRSGSTMTASRTRSTGSRFRQRGLSGWCAEIQWDVILSGKACPVRRASAAARNEPATGSPRHPLVGSQCVNHQRFESIQHSTHAIGDWISFYNHKRRHQALAMKKAYQRGSK